MSYITQIPRNATIKLRALTTNNYEEIYIALPSTIMTSLAFDLRSLVAPLPYIADIQPNESLPDMDFFTRIGETYYAHINYVWYNIMDALVGDINLFEDYLFISENMVSHTNSYYIYGAINGTPVYHEESELSQRSSIISDNYLIGNTGIRPLYAEPAEYYQPTEEEINYPEIYTRRHDFHCKSKSPIVVGSLANRFKLMIHKELDNMSF